MLQFNPISINKLVGIVILGLFIFVSYRFLKLLIKRWIKKEVQESLNAVYVPIIFNFVWIFFFFYTVYVLALVNPIITFFISTIILIATWGYVKDFIQGTLFKVRKGNIIGQLIRMNDASGKVFNMKSTRIHIRLDNGEIIEYPYSKLSNAVISISSNVEDYKKSTFSLSTPYHADTESIIKQLRIALFNIPWIVTNRSIHVEIAHQDAEKVNFKINVYTLDERFVPKIQKIIDMIKFN